MELNLFDENDRFEDENFPEKKKPVIEETPEEREEREIEESIIDKSNHRRKLIAAVVVVLVVIFGLVWLCRHFFSPYVTSTETGVIVKVENKGTIFKTYEVQMVSQKYISDTTRAYGTDFEFTLSDDSLAAQASHLQGTGRQVKVYYEEYSGHIPWRGETNRIVTKIIDNPDSIK